MARAHLAANNPVFKNAFNEAPFDTTRRISMKSVAWRTLGFGTAALLTLLWTPQLSAQTVRPQIRGPYTIQLLYTGPDGQAYAKDIDLPAESNGVVNLLPVNAVEIHRTRPGFSVGWHVEKRRQYLITLSGRGQIDIADGKKIILKPGSILLVENGTGKGHMTRVVGNKQWVGLWLPLVDQDGKSN
jgi:mannose-6-phosphate isomerase-like protein (cupin superfamily)